MQRNTIDSQCENHGVSIEMTILRELLEWTKDAARFLRISRPGVRVPSIAPRKTRTRLCSGFSFCQHDGRGSNRAAAHSAASNQPSGLLLSPRVPTRRNVYRGSCKSKDFMAFLFCKPWVHGFCTVFARSVFSMSDDVGRCIALQSVPFFASGEQGQAELCLHFRVGILQQFQKSRHGDGGFACGG